MSYPITGSFLDEITYDIPSSNWSEKQWRQELDGMVEDQIDTLIFIRGGFEDKMIFPSKHFDHVRDDDFAGFILEEAEKRGIKIFMGLYISNLEWNDGDAAGEIEKNRLFIDEVLERYSRFSSLYGWYIPHECDSDRLNIAQVMAGLSALCKEKAPNMPVLISPFYRTRVSVPEDPHNPDRFYEEWTKIFDKCAEKIDICAFQDGSAPLCEMETYLQKTKQLCEKYNLHCWVNCEGFERDVRHLYNPIPFETLKKKLSIEKNYAEKIITFEYSHFLSRQSIYPSGQNLHARYADFYGPKAEKP